MGNAVSNGDSEITSHNNFENNPQNITSEIFNKQSSSAIRTAMSNLAGVYLRNPSELSTRIRKPDLQLFRHTQLYKEIKANCALPATSFYPNDNWSLTHALYKRESGTASRSPSGSFTENQKRRIANAYIPNKKDDRLMSLESKVYICKFNKDGSKLITACQDSIVRVYDSSKGKYNRLNRIKLTDVYWSILDIDFSPCGKYFTYSTWTDYFFVIPLDSTGDDFQWLDLNSYQSETGVFSLRFSPDGCTIIGGCSDACVYMCDRETRSVQAIRTTRGNSNVDVNAVSYISDTDCNVFVSGSDDGTIKLWDSRCLNDMNGYVPANVFKGHLDGITYIDPRNDGFYILSNSKDQSIKIWDLRRPTANGNCKIPRHTWDYRWDAVPREYYNANSVVGDASVMTFKGHKVAKTLLRAKFSPDLQTGQRFIYTGCSTGRIIIYDVLTGAIREAIEGHNDIVRDLSWHPIRSEIVSSSWDTFLNLNKHIPDASSNCDSFHFRKPVRRSRRIACQNGELEQCDENDEMS